MINSDDGRWRFYMPDDVDSEDEPTRDQLRKELPKIFARVDAFSWVDTGVGERPWQLSVPRLDGTARDTWWFVQARLEPTTEEKAAILDTVHLIWSQP
jgi:hypothetical protein